MSSFECMLYKSRWCCGRIIYLAYLCPFSFLYVLLEVGFSPFCSSKLHGKIIKAKPPSGSYLDSTILPLWPCGLLLIKVETVFTKTGECY